MPTVLGHNSRLQHLFLTPTVFNPLWLLVASSEFPSGACAPMALDLLHLPIWVHWVPAHTLEQQSLTITIC